ncbi:hypothetical protein GF407_05900 [candidate division KSB1 bacterium]|nr:hypothetical protein [candidate division KSB1 bacterium]
MIYGIAGIACLILRWLWDVADPIAITDFKGVFYFREIVTLLPAFLFFYRAFLHSAAPEKRIVPYAKKQWIFLSLLVIFLLTLSIQLFIYQGPQVRDEACYLFQAKTFAALKLWAPAPQKAADSFLFPYTLVKDEKWFGIFFPGTAFIFLFGIWLKLLPAINPLLTAALTAMVYGIAKKWFNRQIAFYTLILMILSPFVLQQGASYFGHIAASMFFVPAAYLLIEYVGKDKRAILCSGFLSGVLMLFRPLSAVVLLVFSMMLLFKRPEKIKSFGRLLPEWFLYLLAFLPGLGLLFLYNKLMTGSFLLTPHQLYFGDPPLQLGWHIFKNFAANLFVLSFDLFGVPLFSLLPLLFVFKKPNRRIVRPVLVLSLINILAYSFYSYHGVSYGPRFLFEITPFLIILSGYGLVRLAEIKRPACRSPFSFLNGILVTAAIIVFAGYLPCRLLLYHQRGDYYTLPKHLFDIDKPAIVVITADEEKKVTPYIAGFKHNDTGLENDILFARDLDEKNDLLLRKFPRHHHFCYNLSTRTLLLFPFQDVCWNEAP